ncbi:MAG: hypothetical protein WBL79_01560 [Bacillota bacterium]
MPRAIRDSPELDEQLAEATGRFERCIALEVLLEYGVKFDRKLIGTRTLGISAARFGLIGPVPDAPGMLRGLRAMCQA